MRNFDEVSNQFSGSRPNSMRIQFGNQPPIHEESKMEEQEEMECLSDSAELRNNPADFQWWWCNLLNFLNFYMNKVGTTEKYFLSFKKRFI